MKRHISILTFLLCAFAAVGWTGAANAATAGYPYYTNSGTTSSDASVVSSEDGVNYTAFPPAGRKVGNWGWADTKAEAMQYGNKDSWSDPAVTATSYSLAGIANANYAKVLFDYITFKVSFNANGGAGTMEAIADKNIDSSITLTANAFSKTGYHFDHWENDLGKTFENKASVSGSDFWDSATAEFHADLKAIWVANTYTVKFDANGGSGSMANESFTYDSAKALTANAFTKSGYAFAGWATNATAGAVVYADKASVKNLTAVNGGTVNLYARWTAKTYTVTFDGNGGTPSTSSKTVTYGSNYGQLATCSRTGYTLDGWYTAASGGTKVEATTTVTITANQTLYAHWTPVTYTITYNGLKTGATHSNPATYTIESDTITFSAPTAVVGFTFNGWSPASLAKGSTGNKTVTASYLTQIEYPTPPAYELAYNGGQQTIASGGNMSASGNQATNPGSYTAVFTPNSGYCWKDGTTANYSFNWKIVNAKIENASVRQSGTLTYTGKPQQATVYTSATIKGSSTPTWKYSTSQGGYTTTMPSFTDAGTHTVYFEVSAPYHESAHGSFEVVIDRAKTAAVDLSKTTFSYTGTEQGPDVTFTHCTEASGSVKKGTYVGTYTIKATPDANYAWSDGGTVTRDFTWQIVEGSFTATVSAGEGGSGGSTFTYWSSPESQTKTIYPLPTRTGYQITGWTASGFAGDAPTVGGTTVTIPARTAGDFTLTPTWAPISYMIVFDGNGGDGEMAPKDLAYDEEYEVPECAFEKTGCEFQSWQVLINDKVVTNYLAGTMVSNLASTAGATVVFRADWTGYYKIAFDANGGDGEMATNTVERDVGYQLPSNAFTRTGYDFIGWTNLSASVGAMSLIPDGATVTNLVAAGETCTLQARWNPHRYTITFDGNGGKGDGPSDIENCAYGEVIDLPQKSGDDYPYTPPKNYATFIGWSTNKSDTVGVYAVSNLTAEADGIVTVYAVWTYDVGEWSRVLDCDNLKFENIGNCPWGIEEGGAQPGSAEYLLHFDAKGEGTPGMLYAKLEASGTLSYYWKGEGDGDEQEFWVGLSIEEKQHYPPGANLDSHYISETQGWTKSEVKIEVPAGEVRYVWFAHRESISVGLDCVTWTPDGAHPEPTDADKVTISSVAASDGKFILSFDSKADFDYNLLTNANLLIGSWGVMATEKGTGETITFEPQIIEGLPQLFYKVETIQRK